MTEKIQWVKVQPPRYQKWEEVGTTITGEVVWYDPYRGERDFNKVECGFLDLRISTGEIVRVCLDRGALNDKLRDAHPRPGDFIGIRFIEEKRASEGKSKDGSPYKTFSVLRGVGGTL